MASRKKPDGSGRRKGSLNRKTQAIAKDMIASGLKTPLEVMIKAMTIHVNARRWDQAAAIAKDAAPYIHPRLVAVARPENQEQGMRDVTPQKPEVAEALAIIRSRLAGPSTPH
jgi:hypothetical protein